MPAIALGGAATAVVGVATAIWLQQEPPPPPPSPKPQVLVDPRPIHGLPQPIGRSLQQDVIVQPLNSDPRPGRPAMLPSSDPPSSSRILIDQSKEPPADKSVFPGLDQPQNQGSKADSVDTLMRQADNLLSDGKISDAEMRLRMIDDPRALVKLARMYDPTQPNRPASTPANSLQAARYYREAADRNDTSARADRERLRQFLLDLAAHDNLEAKAALRSWQ